MESEISCWTFPDEEIFNLVSHWRRQSWQGLNRLLVSSPIAIKRLLYKKKCFYCIMLSTTQQMHTDRTGGSHSGGVSVRSVWPGTPGVTCYGAATVGQFKHIISYH